MKQGPGGHQMPMGKSVTSLDVNVLEKAIAYLVGHFSAYAVYLFGSASRDSLRADSDVDLAFSSVREIDTLSCFEAAQVLADILGRDVDLVNMKHASTVFQIQVLANGKRVYCSDLTRATREEMVAYKSYAMLNEERKEILDTYACQNR